jgi:hypothetical protein
LDFQRAVWRAAAACLGCILLACSSSPDPVSENRTASTVEPPRTVDGEFHPVIKNPAYPQGGGPVVLIDEAHNNFHTADGTYLPFARLLREDGYEVTRGPGSISTSVLESCGVFVVADAQPPERKGDPPTFSHEEIGLMNRWVREGGSLFLITDHMPDPGAIANLARSFGIEVHNGYVLNGFLEGEERPLVFKRSDETLAHHYLTTGGDPSEQVQSVATFAGAAFFGLRRGRR